MAVIKLITYIDAAIGICFDAARDIDAHQHSTSHTYEKVVAGKQYGLCELGDTITWRAKHFGIYQQLTVEIVRMQPPYFFEDRMQKGTFKNMHHEHFFKEENGQTVMTDLFYYEVPFGILGAVFDKLILRRYMTNFLVKRNLFLKTLAENKIDRFKP